MGEQNIMEIILRMADLSDAEKIWKMQTQSFAEQLWKYQDFDTNPGNEPLEKVIMRLEQASTYFYLLESDGEVVGAVRVVDEKKEAVSKRISPLFVLPAYRRRGIAKQAIIEVEKLHGSEGWELATIMEEAGNCRLYEKMGYRATGEMQVINDKLTLVYYRK